MRRRETEAKILQIFQENSGAFVSVQEIVRALGLRGNRVKKLERLLHEMVANGTVTRAAGNRYGPGASEELVTGELDILRSGAGIARDERRNLTVRIAKEDLGTALPGDRVTVRIERMQAQDRTDTGREPERELTGRVVRILERKRHDIVGTVRYSGGHYYVVPLDPSYPCNFRVQMIDGVAVDDRVVIRFDEWPQGRSTPTAEIVDRIGPAADPSLDTVAVIRQFGLRTQFPREVIREAESASERVAAAGERQDLRDLFVFTIDPARARDFDDALSLQKKPDGTRVLGVHIADVSHFVRPGSAIDEEARRRGTSVYFPDGVLPMLPEQLSNGICSLRPDEDRLAFSVFITVDARGNILKREFARTVIRSRLRLTYEQVLPVLEPRGEGESLPAANKEIRHEAIETLRELHQLAQQWRARRFEQYALDLDVPECEIETDRSGMPTSIRISTNDVSHQLIEECMVAANEAVAQELTAAGVPILYRVHEKPHADKIEELTAQLHSLGIKAGNLGNRRNLAALLAAVTRTPLVYHVRTAVLRSMNRAVYSAVPEEHFGLAKRLYTHFTSPIRRYPDLVVHRQLASRLTERTGKRSRPLYTREDLHALAEACSRTEQNADEAERTVDEVKKYRYLEGLLAKGESRVFDAVVVAVTRFGLFAELVDLQLQGLIHVSTLSRGFARFSRKGNYLRDGNKVYTIGHRLPVRVAKVNVDLRQIDFTPA
ncbi:MAG: ribonuclease R [Kiritimatiellia bacterium]